MLNIDIYSTHAVIRSQEPLTVGLVGGKVHFRFSDQWKSLVKTAVFRQGDVTRDIVGISHQTVIPWEVLQKPGLPVQIGVYGSDSQGKVVIPTVWAVTDPVSEGADPDADHSLPPTPEVTQQLQMQIGSLDQLNTAAKDDLVKAINEANRGRFTIGAEGDKVNCTGIELKAAYDAGKVPVLYDGGYLYALEGIGRDENGQLFYHFRCHDKWGDQLYCKVFHDGTLTRSILPAIDLSGYSMLGRVGIIGDSLSVGVEDTGPGTTQQNTDHSWGAYLSRTAGNPCVFLGFSGATSATFIQKGYLDAALKEENRCDAYIIGLGFNDCHGNVPFGNMEQITGSDLYPDGKPYGSYYFNMEKILRKLNEFNPDAPIFLLTNPEFGGSASTEMFNEALRQIQSVRGSKYKARLIDLYKTYGPIFEKLETVRGPNNHFDRQTYAYIGQVIGTAITRDIQKNPGVYPRLKGYLPHVSDPSLRAVCTVKNNGDGTANRTVNDLEGAYKAGQSLVLYDNGYLAALEGIGKDENDQFIFIFRCHDADGAQRVYRISAPNVLNLTTVEASGGSEVKSSVVRYQFETNGESDAISVALPTNWGNVVLFNLHITIPGLSGEMAVVAKSVESTTLDTVSGEEQSGLNVYGIRFFEDYFALSVTKSNTYSVGAQPSTTTKRLKTDAEGNVLTIYSNSDGVVFPAGTKIEGWWVYQ